MRFIVKLHDGETLTRVTASSIPQVVSWLEKELVGKGFALGAWREADNGDMTLRVYKDDKEGMVTVRPE